MVVPKTLRSVFAQQTEVKRSLHTRERRVAMVQARELALACYRTFELARRLLAQKQPFDPNDPSTWDQVLGQPVRKWETAIDFENGKVKTLRVKTDPTNPEDIASGERVMARLTDAISSSKGDISPEELQSRAEVAKAIGDICDESLAKRDQREQRSTLSGRDRKNLLSVRWAEYFKVITESGQWKSRTDGDFGQKFQAFLKWRGDCPFYEVTPDDWSAFQVFLQTDKAPGGKPLAVPTVDKYTTALNGFFKRYAKFAGRDWPIPTAGAHLMTKEAKRKLARAHVTNRNFTPDELKQAFNPAVYVAENKMAHHFWPPLLGLFTGARRAEVCQLLIDDITVINGIPAMKITDLDEDGNATQKQLKTAASERVFPLHPQLIELGFLDYVESVRALKRGKQLFLGLHPNKHGETGNAVGQKWGRYLIKIGLRTKSDQESQESTLTFHSLRHTSNWLLKKKHVSIEHRCQLIGHTLDSQNVTYGGITELATLNEQVIPKFVYDGLDLSGLKWMGDPARVPKRRKLKNELSGRN
jgi:integrase